VMKIIITEAAAQGAEDAGQIMEAAPKCMVVLLMMMIILHAEGIIIMMIMMIILHAGEDNKSELFFVHQLQNPSMRDFAFYITLDLQFLLNTFHSFFSGMAHFYSEVKSQNKN
jgi:hypothetical protein